MSTEQMSRNYTNDQTIGYVDEAKQSRKSNTLKVDINVLMDRVREEKKKEKKENIIFLSLIGSVIVITGVIASL
tara:strand:- start:152 stop:373 length:222 start_codon:yes stop_codon:yes gene_type:complete